MTNRRTYLEYALCPARVPGKNASIGEQTTNACLNRLPCADHNIDNPIQGTMLWGDTYIERYHPPRRSWWQRLTGKATAT